MSHHLGRSHARRLRRLHEVLAEGAATLAHAEDADDRVLGGLVAQVSSLSEAIRGLLVEGWGGPALALCRVQLEAVEWIVHLTEPQPRVTVDDLRGRVRARRARLVERLDDSRFPLTDAERARLRDHRTTAGVEDARHALPSIADVRSRSRTMQRRLVFLRELLLRPTGGLDLGGACGTSDDLEDPAQALVEASRWGFAEAITASRANGMLAVRALARRDDLAWMRGSVRGPQKARARRLREAAEAARNEGTAAPSPDSSDAGTAVPVEV